MTRAKDISKIITDADLSGTLDVTGDLTVVGSSTFDDIKLTTVALPAAGNPSIALRDTNNIVYHQSGSGNSIVLLDSSQNTMYNVSSTSHIFNISNSEKMRIDNSGNVGIGISSPINNLHIQGSSGLRIVNSDDTTNLALLNFDNNESPALCLYSNNTTTVRIHSEGNSYFNGGNVGIGISSPDTTTQISKSTTSTDGSVYPTLKIENTSAGTGNSYARFQVNGGNGTTTFTLLADGRSSNSDVSLRTNTSTPMSFYTNGSERMRIDSNGNVGIGNTASGFNSQADNLVVGTGSGANGITIYSGSDSYADIFFADGTSGSDPVRGGINYNHVNNSMNFRVNDSPKMYILSSGNVGIGTSSPDDKLHVTDSSNAELKLQTDNANGGSVVKFNRSGTDYSYIGTKGYFLGNSDNNLYLRANSGLGIQFYTNGNNERMRIDSSGHVTMPNQPAFQARPSAKLTNITPNTSVDLNFATETFDRNADYNAGGSPSTFTAPVTGVYQLNLMAYIENLEVGCNYFQIAIISSNRNYPLVIDPNFNTNLNYYHMTISVLADMDAGDTAHVSAYQSGGSGATDIDTASYFSGYLVA